MSPEGCAVQSGRMAHTLVPWANGRPLIWDFTCEHRLADSYRQVFKNEGRCVADAAEDKKRTKYAGLALSHLVQPVAFETLGGIGTDTLRFITSLGKKITQATDELRATVFLRQRHGIAIQRGTAACLRETLQGDVEDPIGTLDDDFYHFTLIIQ